MGERMDGCVGGWMDGWEIDRHTAPAAAAALLWEDTCTRSVLTGRRSSISSNIKGQKQMQTLHP